MPLIQIVPPSAKDVNDLEASLGAAYLSAGRQDEATPILESLWQDRQDVQTAYNLAICYRQIGHRAGSRALAQFAYDKDNTIGSFLAEDLLHAGEWDAGWKLFADRYTKDDAAEVFHVGEIPEWQGETDAHLLIVGEGGLGDHVCFSRWLDKIPCKNWCLVVNDDIRWFYEKTKWKHHLKPLEGVTHWTTTFSLPALGLPIPPPTELAYKTRTPPNNRVGLCWQASEPLLRGKKVRSLSMEQAERLVKGLPQYQWVNLQYGWQAPWENPDISTFDKFTKVVAELSAVVSVDTFPMHLAGTLGKPLTVLLGNFEDWKWGEHRNEWYPQAEFITPTLIGGGFDETVDNLINNMSD